jgi:hypothetical protein
MAYPYDILPGGKGASYPVAPAAPVVPNVPNNTPGSQSQPDQRVEWSADEQQIIKFPVFATRGL